MSSFAEYRSNRRGRLLRPGLTGACGAGRDASISAVRIKITPLHLVMGARLLDGLRVEGALEILLQARRSAASLATLSRIRSKTPSAWRLFDAKSERCWPPSATQGVSFPGPGQLENAWFLPIVILTSAAVLQDLAWRIKHARAGDHHLWICSPIAVAARRFCRLQISRA